MAAEVMRPPLNQDVSLGAMLQMADMDRQVSRSSQSLQSNSISTTQPAPWTQISQYTDPRFFIQAPQLVPQSDLERDKAVAERIRVLKEAAVDEGIEWIGASEAGLLAFLKLMPRARKPAIVLSDTGELRAMWDNSREEQIGLRFKATGDVQYVLFRQRRNAPLARSSGIDDPKVVRKHIEALELKRLMSQ